MGDAAGCRKCVHIENSPRANHVSLDTQRAINGARTAYTREQHATDVIRKQVKIYSVAFVPRLVLCSPARSAV